MSSSFVVAAFAFFRGPLTPSVLFSFIFLASSPSLFKRFFFFVDRHVCYSDTFEVIFSKVITQLNASFISSAAKTVDKQMKGKFMKRRAFQCSSRESRASKYAVAFSEMMYASRLDIKGALRNHLVIPRQFFKAICSPDTYYHHKLPFVAKP